MGTKKRRQPTPVQWAKTHGWRFERDAIAHAGTLPDEVIEVHAIDTDPSCRGLADTHRYIIVASGNGDGPRVIGRRGAILLMGTVA